MTFPFPFGGRRITVQRMTENRFNDQTYADHHFIDNAIDYPATTDESGQNVGISDVRSLLVPSGSDLDATDRVILHPEGVTTLGPTDPARKSNLYHVIGLPKDWVHPMTGWAPGMSAVIRRVT